MTFLNFNFFFFIFFLSTRFFSFFFLLFFSSTPFPYLYLPFSFFFCSLTLGLSSLQFALILFFSSSTPLVLSSLLFFSFFLFLFVYSRAEDLSFFLPLTQTNSLSYTHRLPTEKWRSAFYTDRPTSFFFFLFWFD